MRFSEWVRLHERKHGDDCDCTIGKILESWKDERTNVRCVVSHARAFGRIVPKRSIVRFMSRAEKMLEDAS